MKVMLVEGIDLLLLLGWVFIFTPEWIRGPAEAYAVRLLEVSETL